MESLESIKHVAASWVSRRGGEGWTAADEAQLSQWLEASTRNLIAYVRMEATLRETDRLKVLGAGFRGGEVPSAIFSARSCRPGGLIRASGCSECVHAPSG